MKIRMHAPEPPLELLTALRKARLRYTTPVCLYHYLPGDGVGPDCGVFGDGDNAAYEWFIWSNGVLDTSDVAFGSPTIALRDALNRAIPMAVNQGLPKP